MSNLTIIENPSIEVWKSFLDRFPDGNYEQSFEYGEVAKIAFPGTKVVRLVAMDNSKPVGIFQGGYSRYFGFGMNIKAIAGPVVELVNKQKSQVVKALLIALETYGKENRIIKAQIWWPEDWEMEDVFRNLGYTSIEKFNKYVVDLKKTRDELWKSITHNKRRNIKKALKEGVEVNKTHNPNDLLSFYQMLSASAKRQNFFLYPLSGFEAIWKNYTPGEKSALFMAKWKEKNIAGVFILVQERSVYALAAGSLSEKWKVRPNDLLHWKVMEWACERNFSKYHMGFVPEPVPIEGSNSWGIWRWKREWNGNLERLLIFNKYFLPKYKYILNAKRLIEKVYDSANTHIIKRLKD